MALFDDLYKIQKKDLKNAVSVLDNAFSEDSIWKEVFSDEDKNRILTEVMVRFCLKYGNVLSTSDNLEGVMAITPHDKEMTLWSLIRSGAFFLSLKIASEAKVMKVLTNAVQEAKRDLDLGPHIHLLIMGVSQEFQGKGFGGKLLRALIEKAGTERTPIYLETQKEENISLYEKYGFSVKKKVILPEPLNLPMWLMLRDVK
ncbi:MAG: GNAT family N-acetyltransferase [Chloroflexi bacterium]|jgi:ribosomal protein S18 acetylase RimI-like enzyme|nr:GNAT family N-acetyltransferase [Chloroflexota bacterium]MBT7080480.1 GNAT family N-acetyltransferase [Chloroflexota bacterium]